MKNKSFASGINEAINLALSIDKNSICYGLGVTDPKAIFGTTAGLEEKYSSKRVFDMPTSENAMTGVAIGAALGGVRSIMTHQRTDFFLLAMDQLVNGAAKYYYMFGGKTPIPITIRLIIGRGWGQGPTHSQNLHAWFAHIPGLKVVMPSSPSDAKGLLLSSIFDNNPVIFLEHRWLHNSIGDIPEGDYRVPLGKAATIHSGTDITIVSSSYMVIEAIHASNYLKDKKISCDLIDLRTIKPMDWLTISKSIKKTGRLLVVDSGFTTGSISGDIISGVLDRNWNDFKCAPQRLAMPDVPEPTSPALTKGFYVRAKDIAQKVLTMCNHNISMGPKDLVEPEPHDVPGNWFTGPF